MEVNRPHIIDRRGRRPGYDVDWSDEANPRIVPAQPGDRFAMTYEQAEQAIRDQTEDKES